MDILQRNLFFLINKATMVLSNIFQTLKYLIAARPVVETQDLEGRAILHVACYSGYVPGLVPTYLGCGNREG